LQSSTGLFNYDLEIYKNELRQKSREQQEGWALIYKINRRRCKKIISENESEIRKFGVKEIYLFGSVVRGEAKENSDVDFYVVFVEG